ncbi:MAG: hypothetical protein AAFZ15_33895 [Bacteroidota bacterium]
MCSFTDAIPSGDGAIGIGTPIVIGASLGLNVDFGSGTVTQLDSLSFVANGSYDLLGNSGNWSVSLTSSDGNTWDVSIQITGSINQNVNVPNATCNEQGTGTDTTITYSGDSQSIVQYFQDDSIFEKAKIWFEVPFQGNTTKVYFYNAQYYSDNAVKTADFRGEKPLSTILATKYAVVPYQNNELGIADVGLRLDGAGNVHGILQDPDSATMQMVLTAFANHQPVYFSLKTSGLPPGPRFIQQIKIGNA